MAHAAYGMNHSRTIPECVKGWRKQTCYCAGCGLRIAENIEFQTRGTNVLHPSCARKHDAQQRTVSRSVAPSVHRKDSRARVSARRVWPAR